MHRVQAGAHAGLQASPARWTAVVPRALEVLYELTRQTINRANACSNIGAAALDRRK
jgi:hypothetical protein